MTISIFGLGYVGAVTAGCLIERRHRVIGVDVYEKKVAALAAGRSPIVEPGLDELLQGGVNQRLLSATTDSAQAVADSDVSIVCVGTPSLENGRLNLQYVRTVAGQIAAAVRAKAGPHVLVFRSTMLPGSTRSIVSETMPDLIAEGRITVLYCPEFLREGTAVADFRQPSLAVVGTMNGEASARHEAESLLGDHSDRMTWDGAELIKYACNYFHAVKVAFANEIGRAGKHAGLDAGRVMEVVCKDTRLNISPYYLRPGNPYGGSCLPKDVSALAAYARQEGVLLPLLESLAPSNSAHLDALIRMVLQTGCRRVAILGLAFKNDTDDLRGSPMVSLAESLLGRGIDLHIYDPNLHLAGLIGSNEQLISRSMPHLSRLLRPTAGEAIGAADLIVAAQPCVPLAEFRNHVQPRHRIIDVNGWRELSELGAQYEGFCW